VNERNDVDVDLDRLADFISGALDGTPDAEAVRRLVTTDPRWSRAYAALLDADAAVRADLAAYAADTVALPPDVAARLDTALHAAQTDAPDPPSARHMTPYGERGAATGFASGSRPDTRPPDTRPPDTRPPDMQRTGARRPEVRRARRRWAIAMAAAAAVVVGALGVSTLLPQLAERNSTSTAGSDKGAQVAAGSPEGGSSAADVPTLASGTDYRPDTLRALATYNAPAAPNAQRSAAGVPEGPRAADTAGGVPDELAPLTPPAARAACLDAVTRRYGGTVALVDYARFEGRPALVVVLNGTRAAGNRLWVVVVGPQCGRGGAIADERFTGTVG
jgi:hypothetical protein